MLHNLNTIDTTFNEKDIDIALSVRSICIYFYDVDIIYRFIKGRENIVHFHSLRQRKSML